MVERHKHNGTDSEQIEYTDLSILPETAIADVPGTAGAAYTAAEQAIINSQTEKINAILAALRNKRIIKE